jgi:hypothetical protein
MPNRVGADGAGDGDFAHALVPSALMNGACSSTRMNWQPSALRLVDMFIDGLCRTPDARSGVRADRVTPRQRIGVPCGQYQTRCL